VAKRLCPAAAASAQVARQPLEQNTARRRGLLADKSSRAKWPMALLTAIIDQGDGVSQTTQLKVVSGR
jgi:hypothetical protein